MELAMLLSNISKQQRHLDQQILDIIRKDTLSCPFVEVVGTEAHTNKQLGGERTTNKQNRRGWIPIFDI